jgi:hypothetical protein
MEEGRVVGTSVGFGQTRDSYEDSPTLSTSAGVPPCSNLDLVQVINSRSDLFNATLTTPKVCFIDFGRQSGNIPV